MAKKAKATVLTHTEILVLAITEIERRRADVEQRYKDLPETDRVKELRSAQMEPLNEKYEALTMMYRIETGRDY